MAAVLAVILILGLPRAFADPKVTSGECSYYWKSYDGDIPEDAVPGGRDSNGDVFYIGLVQLKLINEIFAGMIVPEIKAARITSLGITRDVRNDPFTVVSILCSPDLDAFEWVGTRSEDLHLLMDRNLVGGGKVLGQDLYIGRVLHDGGTLLGKVFPHKFIYQGLYVPSGGTFEHFLYYNVLVFNCKKEKTEVLMDGEIGTNNTSTTNNTKT